MDGNLDKEFVVGFLVVFIAAFVIIALLTGFWESSIPEIHQTGNIQTECAEWVSETPPCPTTGEDENPYGVAYPTLMETYGLDVAAAKAACNCP